MIETGSDPVPPHAPHPSSPETRFARPRSLSWSVKRGLDIVVAATSIFLLLPLLLLVTGAIWAMDRGSPFERETLLGCGGRSFQCLRFRTTGPDTATETAPVDLAETGRVTVIGRILSETSLDELPKLVNVLRGDMSLVGPRPLAEESAVPVGHGPDPRLTVPPGLTGAGLIEGGPEATKAERIALDRDYAGRWSLRRDFVILIRSLAANFVRPNQR